MSSVEDVHPASEPIARSRYTRTAVALHWAIAMLMLTVIPLGIYGANNDTPAGAVATGLHKPIGILILLLTLVRIGWRLGHAPPPLPSTLARPLRAFAQATHFAFYGLLLALPLSGWWMSSAFPKRYPIKVGELFEVPFLPVPIDLKVALAVHGAHVNLGLLTLCLIGLHVAAALKHHFVDRDDILLRMLHARR